MGQAALIQGLSQLLDHILLSYHVGRKVMEKRLKVYRRSGFFGRGHDKKRLSKAV
jgi:hypothetical protein